MDVNKSLKRSKQQFKAKHGIRVSGRSYVRLITYVINKRAKKALEVKK